MRDKKAKEPEQKVHMLQQQLQAKEEKQKQNKKDKSTTELYKSLEHCKQLEIEKLKQLDNLIKEKKQDQEEYRR